MLCELLKQVHYTMEPLMMWCDSDGVMLSLDDLQFQQLNPGIYTVSLPGHQHVSAQLIFTPTEVHLYCLFLLLIYHIMMLWQNRRISDNIQILRDNVFTLVI